MNDPSARMRGLAPQIEIAGQVAIELGAGGRQLAHPVRPLLDEHLDRGCVTERRTSRERIAPV